MRQSHLFRVALEVDCDSDMPYEPEPRAQHEPRDPAAMRRLLTSPFGMDDDELDAAEADAGVCP